MRKIALVCILCILVVILSGCNLFYNSRLTRDIERSKQLEQDENFVPVNPEMEEKGDSIVLYFGDDTGNFLVPEVRMVNKGSEKLESVIVKELIKGTNKAGRKPLIHPDTRLISFSENEGVAFVNFDSNFLNTAQDIALSKEDERRVRALAIYSVVNSITELGSINSVQILVEGQKMEMASIHPFIQEEDQFFGDDDAVQLLEPLRRNRDIILNPANVVKLYFESLSAKDWEGSFKYIAHNGEQVLTYEEYLSIIENIDPVILKYDVLDYEILIRGDEALVNASYDLRLKDEMETSNQNALIKLVKIDDLWKVKWDSTILPQAQREGNK
ncbi:MAG TPA: GerMN domain-containing protein [Clostridiales bacterium]|nr:GerMN domain-containing protein [Clostridiales bacterium]